MDFPVFEQVLRTNVIGPLKMASAFLPNLGSGPAEEEAGQYLQQRGLHWLPREPAALFFYRSSKAALNMEMKNLASVLKNRGMSVAMINPGPVDTDMMAGMPKRMLRSKDTAVSDMIRITDQLKLDNTGLFWNYSGEQLPW